MISNFPTGLRSLLMLVVLPLLAPAAHAQSVYRAGDTVENFSLVNRATGERMQLTDLAGKIVFIDFFAYWCVVCNAAAPQLEAGIYERYREAGNAAGLPVVYVLANLQDDFSPRDIAGTDSFISRFGPDVVVLQDTSRALQRRFTSSNGQPTFAVINGVAGSSSHRQWELVYSLHGYTSPGRVQPITEFQAAIDSVKAPAAEPVSIIEHPQSRDVPIGQTVAFAVKAAGSPPLDYTWEKDGKPLSGSSGPVLTIENARLTDVGEYRVVVSNGISAQASEIASLAVLSPPAIATHPRGGTIAEGAMISLLVVATGSAPLTYQWLRNGEVIPGATQPTLLLDNVSRAQGGTYAVQVSNALGTVASDPALVTITSPTPAPARLTNFRLLPTGGFHFEVHAEEGSSHRVEVSSNLRDWTLLTQLHITIAPHVVLDPLSTDEKARFYRVIGE